MSDERLAATATACRARRDRCRLELLEVLEHADHRVARCSMRLVRDRTTEADTQLCPQLRLDQPVGPERLFRIVVAEICFAPGGGNPDGGEGSRTATRLRDSKLLDRAPQTLAHQRYRGQSNQTIVVVVGP